jgi:prepilin-type N-terminal cleavage/methylation domain-containing protein
VRIKKIINYELTITNLKMIKKNGFTLFELLVSISIIAILMALATASYSAAQKKARDARRQEDMGSVQKAAEQYYMLNSSNYPVAGWAGVGTSWSVNGTTVLPVFPTDPKGVGYSAPSVSSATTYCMCAHMEGATGNSHLGDCNYATAGSKDWFCVNNQQ